MKNIRAYNMVSRVVLLIMIMGCVLCLSGCGFLSTIDEKLRENKIKSDDKYWTERNVPPVDLDLEVSCPGKVENFDVDLRVSRCVYRYLEDGDKQLLKRMFAKSVVDNYGDLDSDLDALIDYYQSLEVAGYEMKENSLHRIHRLEPNETISEYTYHTMFICKEVKYELDIMFVMESTRDKDLLGVHGIGLRNRDTNEKVIVNTVNKDI